MKILSESQDKLLKEERHILNRLRKSLIEFGAAVEDQTALDESIQQLDDFFLLVVVGEFNAGKSAFINALLGQQVLKEGVTPTTTQINILRYGEEQTRTVLEENIHVLSAPVDLLTEISIVDTPGANAIIREHEEITSKFIPRSDLVLFVTSADRPFTESERAFLERIQDWGKKVVVIVNKIDILKDADEWEEIRGFITENARNLLKITPELFPISAQNALLAKQGQPKLWPESRFEALETYIHETLDETSRLRLKLFNPLGVGQHLTSRYTTVFEERLDLLQEDLRMMDDIDAQLAMYQKDMLHNFELRMAEMSNILLEMEQRGQDFFDEHIRLGRVFDLLKKERIQRSFEGEVVTDVPQQIERKVDGLIDWLVDANLRQWQSATEHIADRRQKHKDRMVGDIGSFHYDRERLINSISREAKEAVDTYDKRREASQIAQGAQNAVAATAALEVGAIGLGTVVTIIASSVTADVTGILLASLVAALGLFIIPTRRKKAKKEMHAKVAKMRSQLIGALRTHFDSEIGRSLQNIHETIAPYTRFVRSERDNNQSSLSTCQELGRELEQLKSQVEGMGK